MQQCRDETRPNGLYNCYIWRIFVILEGISLAISLLRPRCSKYCRKHAAMHVETSRDRSLAVAGFDGQRHQKSPGNTSRLRQTCRRKMTSGEGRSWGRNL